MGYHGLTVGPEGGVGEMLPAPLGSHFVTAPGFEETVSAVQALLKEAPDGFDNRHVRIGASAFLVSWRPTGTSAGVATIEYPAQNAKDLLLLMSGRVEFAKRTTRSPFSSPCSASSTRGQTSPKRKIACVPRLAPFR